MPNSPDFVGFPKMARLSREVIVTEKIDGTNAQIFITDDGDVFAGSRTRWVTTSDDNYGFAKWVEFHKGDLLSGLGPGRHFGEWWGQGIQRNYGLKEKRFSLFNVLRWAAFGAEPQRLPYADPRIEKYQDIAPECCSLVPVLWRGIFDTLSIDEMLLILKMNGSLAAPGFMNPEGVVIFHMAANIGFKKTILKDEKHKGEI